MSHTICFWGYQTHLKVAIWVYIRSLLTWKSPKILKHKSPFSLTFKESWYATWRLMELKTVQSLLIDSVFKSHTNTSISLETMLFNLNLRTLMWSTQLVSTSSRIPWMKKFTSTLILSLSSATGSSHALISQVFVPHSSWALLCHKRTGRSSPMVSKVKLGCH